MMLARTFCRTLGELGATMTSAEFAEWIEEYIREPWGEYRADLRSAVEAVTVANYAGKMRKEPAQVTDFLLDFDRSQVAVDEIPPEQVFGNMN
jgi:hypothetical protein